jgi:hypothetical protein
VIAYSLSAQGKALEAVMTATKSEKTQLANVFANLMQNPFQEGDSETTTHGRKLQVKSFGTWLVTYWADHAVKEVRVIDVVNLK